MEVEHGCHGNAPPHATGCEMFDTSGVAPAELSKMKSTPMTCGMLRWAYRRASSTPAEARISPMVSTALTPTSSDDAESPRYDAMTKPSQNDGMAARTG